MDINYDKQLNIDTNGTIYWSRKFWAKYHESEPTGYSELNELFEHYHLQPGDHFVDIGSGKGRIVFYVNHFHQVPVTGVELHPQTFHQLSQNEKGYLKEHSNNPKVELINRSAETYDFSEEQNVIYMFNPFSPAIFKKMMANLMKSIEDHPRRVDLILYYPMNAIRFFIDKKTPFDLFKSVNISKFKDKTERFDIFRYDPK